MDNLETFLAQVDALPTLEEKITALKGGLNALFGAKEASDSKYSDLEKTHQETLQSASALQEEYTALESESKAEIERLSKELSFTTNVAGKSLLSVEVDGKRYTTPAGRKWNLNGKIVAAEDLVKDPAAVLMLIGKKSGIFTVSTE